MIKMTSTYFSNVFAKFLEVTKFRSSAEVWYSENGRRGSSSTNPPGG